MFEPICLKNQLIIPDDKEITHPHLAVCCLWEPREKINKWLKEKTGIVPGVIGQLYSPTRGIYPMIINLLNNPQIERLLIISEQAAEASPLYNFFEDLHKLVEYMKKASIPNSNKSLFEKAIDFYNKYNINMEIRPWDLAEINQIYKTYLSKPRIHKLAEIAPDKLKNIVEDYTRTKLKYNYQLPKVKTTRDNNFPACGKLVEGNSIASVWLKLLKQIRQYGKITPTHYEINQQEIYNLTTIIHNAPLSVDGQCIPRDKKTKEEIKTWQDDLNRSYPDWLPIDGLKKYTADLWHGNSDPNKKYTYGSRIGDQKFDIINKLIENLDQRSAAAVLYTPEDAHQKSGTPCVVFIHFRCVHKLLHMSVILRSNDMFSGWPMNIAAFRNFQYRILNEIKKSTGPDSQFWDSIKIGDTITHSLSAHIYEDCFKFTDDVLEKLEPDKETFDPYGNWIINPETATLVDSVSGKDIKQFDLGVIDQEFFKSIGSYIQNPAHALYVGYEIAKARMQRELYVQK